MWETFLASHESFVIDFIQKNIIIASRGFFFKPFESLVLNIS